MSHYVWDKWDHEVGAWGLMPNWQWCLQVQPGEANKLKPEEIERIDYLKDVWNGKISKTDL